MMTVRFTQPTTVDGYPYAATQIVHFMADAKGQAQIDAGAAVEYTDPPNFSTVHEDNIA